MHSNDNLDTIIKAILRLANDAKIAPTLYFSGLDSKLEVHETPGQLLDKLIANESKSTTRAAASKPAKTPAKPAKPASEAEIRRAVRLRCRRTEGVSSAELANIIPGKPEARTAFLNKMIRDGILRKEGKSKRTRYYLKGKAPVEEEGEAG